jgi:hypothetical protein
MEIEMSKIYLGLAVSASMFAHDFNIVEIERLSIEEDMDYILALLRGEIFNPVEVINCFNSSHTATIEVLEEHGFNFSEFPVPEIPPKIILSDGDRLVVFQVEGLPRLTDRHQYTKEEILSAKISIVIFNNKGESVNSTEYL